LVVHSHNLLRTIVSSPHDFRDRSLQWNGEKVSDVLNIISSMTPLSCLEIIDLHI
jgi:hypothetical protein